MAILFVLIPYLLYCTLYPFIHAVHVHPCTLSFTLYPFMHTVCSCPFLYIVLSCTLYPFIHTVCSCPFLYIVLVQYIRLCALFVLVRSCTSVLVYYIRLCTLYVLVRSWHCPYLYFLCFWTLLRFWYIIYKSILSLLTIHLIPHTLLCFEITEKAKCIRLLTDVYVDGGWALRFGWEKKPSNTPFKKIHLFHLQFDLTGDGGTFPLPPPCSYVSGM